MEFSQMPKPRISDCFVYLFILRSSSNIGQIAQTMEFYQHRQIYQSDGIVESIAYELDADYDFLSFHANASLHRERLQKIVSLNDWIDLIAPDDLPGYMMNLEHADKQTQLISAYRLNVDANGPVWVMDYSAICKGEEAVTRGVFWLAKGIDEVAMLMKRYVI